MPVRIPRRILKHGNARAQPPDICLVAPGTVRRILDAPPTLCVEIISSGQTLRDIQGRTDDYLAMGVVQVRVLDPVRRKAYAPDAAGVLQPASGRLTVKATPIALDLEDIFREYDDLAAGR